MRPRAGSGSELREVDLVRTGPVERIADADLLANVLQELPARRPGHNLHSPAEIGVESFQTDRSPTRATVRRRSRAWSHRKGGFYHDGRFADLGAVVRHYDRHLVLRLGAEDVNDLVEYLKSL